MDDIITGTKGVEQHLQELEHLFTRLEECGYKLKLYKCELLWKKVMFTGLDVSQDGVHITEDKLKHMDKLSPLKTVSDVKSLLGFTSFLCAHIPYYCEITRLIQDLVVGKKQKNADITKEWTTQHDRALEQVKVALREARVLAFPDAQKEFSLYTDASKFHMSRVLMQGDKAAPKVIGYWSKSFKGSQINWSLLVKEVQAVYEACKHFSVFILGDPTTLYCDHKPLPNFLRNQTKNAMVNRWSLDIQEYALKFVWVDTHTNISDCLS